MTTRMSLERPGPVLFTPPRMFSTTMSSSCRPCRETLFTVCLIEPSRSRPLTVRPVTPRRTPSRTPPWIACQAMKMRPTSKRLAKSARNEMSTTAASMTAWPRRTLCLVPRIGVPRAEASDVPPRWHNRAARGVNA